MDAADRRYELAWNARDYLRQYYSGPEVSGDEVANARFIARRLGMLGRTWERALEFGCGPTIHHAASIAPYALRIDMADYLAANLDEVRRWRDEEENAHDWDSYLGNVIVADGENGPEALRDRKRMLRGRMGELRMADIRNARPLGDVEPYPLVASYYCAEAVASSREEWAGYLRNVSSLVAPGGTLLLGAMRRCREYRVFGNAFPSAYIDETDLAEELRALGFDPESTTIEVADHSGWDQEGFSGICCVMAVKRG